MILAKKIDYRIMEHQAKRGAEELFFIASQKKI
jgi:hypothetical protein